MGSTVSPWSWLICANCASNAARAFPKENRGGGVTTAEGECTTTVSWRARSSALEDCADVPVGIAHGANRFTIVTPILTNKAHRRQRRNRGQVVPQRPAAEARESAWAYSAVCKPTSNAGRPLNAPPAWKSLPRFHACAVSVGERRTPGVDAHASDVVPGSAKHEGAGAGMYADWRISEPSVGRAATREKRARARPLAMWL